MPEYLTPAVYIEEIDRGPRPIEGVPTSTAAFLGETERGPITPRLITSYAEYQRWFGDVFGQRDRFMPYAANGFFENGGRRLYVCRIVGQDGTLAQRVFGNYTVRATGPGAWGNRVWVSIQSSSTVKPDPADPSVSIPVGFRMKVAYWSVPVATPFDPFDAGNRSATPQPTYAEDFDNLTLEPTSWDYYEKRLLDSSSLVTLTRTGGAEGEPIPFETDTLSDGSDDASAVDSDDYAGEVAGNRNIVHGLKALEQDAYREVALVHAPFPPANADEVARAVIRHCEILKFRFAVVDTAPRVSDPYALEPRTGLTDTQHAALYYPWLVIADPQSEARRMVPPGGYVLGVYARSDIEHGVFKAPANEIVRGAIDLEFPIDDRQQGVLNPRGVNAIRRLPGRGILIWGARTLSSNDIWKYVSVRRLFIFLERSINEGTQWVVFEPNDERLWARVKDTIRLFLRGQWRAGALMGAKEEEAFFVTCDRTTMTQDDILNGRLICEIGIAPVRPAEFVVFRVSRHTAKAQQ
jgi:phage tail sheath protein FI